MSEDDDLVDPRQFTNDSDDGLSLEDLREEKERRKQLIDELTEIESHDVGAYAALPTPVLEKRLESVDGALSSFDFWYNLADGADEDDTDEKGLVDPRDIIDEHKENEDND